MNKKCILIFGLGALISLTASAMFMNWMKMPMDMANSMMNVGSQQQPIQRRQPAPLVCDCRCNDKGE